MDEVTGDGVGYRMTRWMRYRQLDGTFLATMYNIEHESQP